MYQNTGYLWPVFFRIRADWFLHGKKNGSGEASILADLTYWATLQYLHLSFWSVDLSKVLTRSRSEESCFEKCLKIHSKALAIESYFSKVTKPRTKISINWISICWRLLWNLEKRQILYFSRKSVPMFRKSSYFPGEIF